MTITVRGVVFAGTSAPGYAVGKRVVVTVPLAFTAPQIAAIDAVKGSEVTIAAVPFAASHYKLSDGTNYANGGSGTVDVVVGVVQGENETDGKRTFRALLTDQTTGALYHSGSACLTAFDTIGTVFSDPGATPPTADVDEPGYGLYTESWNDKNFNGQITDTDHNRIFAAAPAFAWTGSPDTTINDQVMTNNSMSLRFVGYVRMPSAGTWRFVVTTKFGADIDLWLDDILVATREAEVPVQDSTLLQVNPTSYAEYTEDQMVRIRFDYEVGKGPQAMKLEYQEVGQAAVVIPITQLYSGPQVGTIATAQPPDQSKWYIEEVTRYQET